MPVAATSSCGNPWQPQAVASWQSQAVATRGQGLFGSLSVNHNRQTDLGHGLNPLINESLMNLFRHLLLNQLMNVFRHLFRHLLINFIN